MMAGRIPLTAAGAGGTGGANTPAPGWRQGASIIQATPAWTTHRSFLAREGVIGMAKVRWGILSTANIGMAKVNPAIQQGQYCEIVAIASRDQQAAERAAGRLGVAKAYGS